ncbi:Zinc finger C3H1-type [Carpediemonas membranifera]|uniref:Zinc finger C3H1-type n=1 Tax=Carpediemonas membranifera TaxID=201153 RepID=A0A8J6E4X5_9EUKA|nr:Zinc finger C3H1-type [Carpediemonas membranifera]|eukprot:KAG9397481.1 Zinc finger C3H1-type [Carpediemonas membranifera]
MNSIKLISRDLLKNHVPLAVISDSFLDAESIYPLYMDKRAQKPEWVIEFMDISDMQMFLSRGTEMRVFETTFGTWRCHLKYERATEADIASRAMKKTEPEDVPEGYSEDATFNHCALDFLPSFRQNLPVRGLCVAGVGLYSAESPIITELSMGISMLPNQHIDFTNSLYVRPDGKPEGASPGGYDKLYTYISGLGPDSTVSEHLSDRLICDDSVLVPSYPNKQTTFDEYIRAQSKVLTDKQLRDFFHYDPAASDVAVLVDGSCEQLEQAWEKANGQRLWCISWKVAAMHILARKTVPYKTAIDAVDLADSCHSRLAQLIKKCPSHEFFAPDTPREECAFVKNLLVDIKLRLALYPFDAAVLSQNPTYWTAEGLSAGQVEEVFNEAKSARAPVILAPGPEPTPEPEHEPESESEHENETPVPPPQPPQRSPPPVEKPAPTPAPGPVSTASLMASQDVGYVHPARLAASASASTPSAVQRPTPAHTPAPYRAVGYRTDSESTAQVKLTEELVNRTQDVTTLVCRDYLLGRCRAAADQCKLVHIEVPDSVCGHFLAGDCKYGNRCRKTHPHNAGAGSNHQYLRDLLMKKATRASHSTNWASAQSQSQPRQQTPQPQSQPQAHFGFVHPSRLPPGPTPMPKQPPPPPPRAPEPKPQPQPQPQPHSQYGFVHPSRLGKTAIGTKGGKGAQRQVKRSGAAGYSNRPHTTPAPAPAPEPVTEVVKEVKVPMSMQEMQSKVLSTPAARGELVDAMLADPIMQQELMSKLSQNSQFKAQLEPKAIQQMGQELEEKFRAQYNRTLSEQDKTTLDVFIRIVNLAGRRSASDAIQGNVDFSLTQLINSNVLKFTDDRLGYFFSTRFTLSGSKVSFTPRQTGNVAQVHRGGL